MTDPGIYRDKILGIRSAREFNDLALELFHLHYRINPVYSRHVDNLHLSIGRMSSVEEIPCFPVEFFKSHRIVAGDAPPRLHFRTSGTTSGDIGIHYLADPGLYEEAFRTGFRHFYGDIREYCLIALLPSYLENPHSSLIYMVKDLIAAAGPGSGFYSPEDPEIPGLIRAQTGPGRKVMVFGVTYALLDFAEASPMPIPSAIIMETGGMKGRRREMVREEVHEILCKAFQVKKIHSEYGMTELLSQAYSKGGGVFRTPPWMKVLVRDMHDPLSPAAEGRTGGINVIDLANLYSCPFIATQDLGKAYSDGSFEVLGRFDASDLRGCNLMAE